MGFIESGLLQAKLNNLQVWINFGSNAPPTSRNSPCSWFDPKQLAHCCIMEQWAISYLLLVSCFFNLSEYEFSWSSWTTCGHCSPTPLTRSRDWRRQPLKQGEMRKLQTLLGASAHTSDTVRSIQEYQAFGSPLNWTRIPSPCQCIAMATGQLAKV